MTALQFAFFLLLKGQMSHSVDRKRCLHVRMKHSGDFQQHCIAFTLSGDRGHQGIPQKRRRSLPVVYISVCVSASTHLRRFVIESQ